MMEIKYLSKNPKGFAVDDIVKPKTSLFTIGPNPKIIEKYFYNFIENSIEKKGEIIITFINKFGVIHITFDSYSNKTPNKRISEKVYTSIIDFREDLKKHFKKIGFKDNKINLLDNSITLKKNLLNGKEINGNKKTIISFKKEVISKLKELYGENVKQKKITLEFEKIKIEMKKTYYGNEVEIDLNTIGLNKTTLIFGAGVESFHPRNFKDNKIVIDKIIKRIILLHSIPSFFVNTKGYKKMRVMGTSVLYAKNSKKYFVIEEKNVKDYPSVNFPVQYNTKIYNIYMPVDVKKSLLSKFRTLKRKGIDCGTYYDLFYTSEENLLLAERKEESNITVTKARIENGFYKKDIDFTLELFVYGALI